MPVTTKEPSRTQWLLLTALARCCLNPLYQKAVNQAGWAEGDTGFIIEQNHRIV